MKTKIPFILILLFIFQVGFARTIRVTTFDDLMTSLNSGESVRVVIHYQQCTWQDSSIVATTPNAITGMNIDTYEYFAKGTVHNKKAFVVFSNSKLIQNPIGKGFVYNYGKVRISDDNSVIITAKYIDPINFEVLMNEVFIGKIANEKTNNSVNLFKQESIWKRTKH